VVAAISPGEAEDWAGASPDPQAFWVAAWRLQDGRLLGLLGPHPWEVEHVQVVGRVAVCGAYDSHPAELWCWDLLGDGFPGAPSKVAFPHPVLALGARGHCLAAALTDGSLWLVDLSKGPE